MPAPDFTAEAIFADAIRREDTGKLLMVGGYSGELRILGPFTNPLPLVAFVTVRGRPDATLTKLGIEARLDNVVVAQHEIAGDMLDASVNSLSTASRQLIERAIDAGAERRLIRVQVEVGLVLPPSETDGVLVLAVDLGEGMEPAGVLMIRSNALPEEAAVPINPRTLPPPPAAASTAPPPPARTPRRPPA